MALEGEQLLAGRAVPDLHRLVALPEARRWPSGLNATLETPPAWPFRANSSLPVALSQIFTVWSLLADASRWPSGLNATIEPGGVALEGEQLLAGRAVPDLHRMVIAADARRWPSGLNATLVTHGMMSANSSLPVALSQIFTVVTARLNPGAGRPG